MTRDELIEELKRCPYNCDVTVAIDGQEYDVERIIDVPNITIVAEE